MDETIYSRNKGKTEFVPIITNSRNAAEVLQENGIVCEEEIDLRGIAFCKVEAWQDCLMGSFCIPKLEDIEGSGHRLMFFITEEKVILVDDQDFAAKLVSKIDGKRTNQHRTKEGFLYNFMAEFISRDLEYLMQLEINLMKLEEAIQSSNVDTFQSDIRTIRRELLILRGYYDEITDVGIALEENENEYFEKRQLKYFGTIADRAERLMNKASHLLEYAEQVKDTYQAQIDEKKNNNMQFLTVISTIFFPLTLITGWYGMNFQNMPELAKGYPGVIVLSIVIIIVCVIIFKIKKIF